MANIETLMKNLELHRIRALYFATAKEAADYLDKEIDGVSVGFGGSGTAKDMELYPRLSAHNKCFWHWEGGTLTDAMSTDVYISSANAIAETGEIVNIDGNCNRISSLTFGHSRVYFVVGVNKITPDYDSALWRARNIASPKRAQQLNRKTPCAVKADKCYNCTSPERVCNGLSVIWCKPGKVESMEVVLIGEELGL